MTEKTPQPTHCLNCGHELTGRYCSNCSQDSWAHSDSMWHLATHFFSDITHYDSQFLKTLKPLLFKPGFLTLEYLKGKRASYLNPVRLFVFLNFILFVLIAWLPGEKAGSEKKPGVNIKFSNKVAHQPFIHVGNVTPEPENTELNGIISFNHDSVEEQQNPFNQESYDSLQKTLPEAQRDGRIKRALILKIINGVEKLQSDPRRLEAFAETFLHNVAELDFLFLIVCACLLKLLYYRRHVLMVNHALFAIHVSCTFLLLSVIMLLVGYLPHSDFWVMVVFLYGNYYFFRALMVVYRQSILKTGLKFILIEMLLAVAMGIALVVNALGTIIFLKG